MKYRYTVERVNEPKGWIVMDRKTHRMVQFCLSRADARKAAREGNELEEANQP